MRTGRFKGSKEDMESEAPAKPGRRRGERAYYFEFTKEDEENKSKPHLTPTGSRFSLSIPPRLS